MGILEFQFQHLHWRCGKCRSSSRVQGLRTHSFTKLSILLNITFGQISVPRSYDSRACSEFLLCILVIYDELSIANCEFLAATLTNGFLFLKIDYAFQVLVWSYVSYLSPCNSWIDVAYGLFVWLDSVLSFLNFSYKTLTMFLFMLNVHFSCLSFGFDLETGGFL
jgi:hypothetical protein